MNGLNDQLRRHAHAVLRDALDDSDPRTRIHAAVAVLSLDSHPAPANAPVKSAARASIDLATEAAIEETTIDTPASPTAEHPRPACASSSSGARPASRPSRSTPSDSLLAALVPEPSSEPFERQFQDRLRARILGEPAPEPPRVGNLVVRRRLGGGSMGLVYAAYDERLDREVALKLVHPTLTEAPQADQRLLEEARSLARLSHPNLVPVFDVGTWQDQAYVTMELVSGPTLRGWEAEPRPWSSRVARWLEVARAVQAVHAAGLLHRDIKPDNVVIGHDGRSRLVDFGLASPIDGGTAHRFAGTPGYMAPELLQAQTEGPTVAADLYSLCVGLYESLCGRRPRGPVRAGQALPVPDGLTLPSPLRTLLQRGLAERPEDRPHSAAEIIDTLTAVLVEHGVAQAA